MRKYGLALFLLAATAVFAQEPPQSEDAELAELMSVIEQETAIATKTRMNSDYVPGIVTVLEGDELDALGFDTVWEALALVPGVQAVRDPSATPTVIVRGIQFPFNNGNIKILVDGVPLSRESSGINGATLDFPIQQVERIEFIRGPGSVIYGDFAFMGLVNIITRKERSAAYVRGDTDRFLEEGVRVALGSATAPWQFAASYVAVNDNDIHRTNRNGDEERHWGSAMLRHNAFSLSAQVVQRDAGDTTQPPRPGPPIFADESSWSAQARYAKELRKSLQSTFNATLLDSTFHSGGDDYADRVLKAGVDLQYDALRRQSWLASAEFAGLDIRNAVHRGPPGPGGVQQITTIEGVERNIYSLALQDRFDFSDAFSLTGGARLDKYSDLGSRVTPRLSFVWRVSDQHIVKGQYAEGFRAPTFFELFGGGRINRELDFEVNATTELNYVYRRPRSVGRATVFHSELKDMIFGGLPGGRFGNTRKASAQGVELEWTQQVSDAVKLLANVGIVDTEDNRGQTLTVHESENAADWMSDVALLVRPLAQTIVGLHWNHVGERQAAAGNAYDALDLTYTRQNLFFDGLTLRAGVKNALDDDITSLAIAPNGTATAFAFDDRAVWVQVGWRR